VLERGKILLSPSLLNGFPALPSMKRPEPASRSIQKTSCFPAFGRACEKISKKDQKVD
jgi:hypothetical protein